VGARGVRRTSRRGAGFFFKELRGLEVAERFAVDALAISLLWVATRVGSMHVDLEAFSKVAPLFHVPMKRSRRRRNEGEVLVVLGVSFVLRRGSLC
jgi:hypothetical protein